MIPALFNNTDIPFSPPIGPRSHDKRMTSPSTNQHAASSNITVRRKYEIVGEKVNDILENMTVLWTNILQRWTICC